MVLSAHPLGCTPSFLTSFAERSTANDSLGCLKDYNDLFMYHNNHLQIALQEVRKQNPNVTIVYSDLYDATMWVLNNLSSLGEWFISTTKSYKLCA